jgi:hypothetical protein
MVKKIRKGKSVRPQLAQWPSPVPSGQLWRRCAGNPSMQAAVLCAVINHPSLAPARMMAGIDSAKHQETTNFLCQQSACLMSHNRTTESKHGNTTANRCDAVVTVFTFMAPSPGKKDGVPSERECARVMGVPRTTLQHVHKKGTEKRRLLTAGETGVYWSRAH